LIKLIALVAAGVAVVPMVQQLASLAAVVPCGEEDKLTAWWPLFRVRGGIISGWTDDG